MRNMNTYLVIDLKTGALDGFYFNKKDAEAVVSRFEKRYPKGMWALTEVLNSEKNGGRKTYYIPENMFHTERLAG
jgi:hypothetical protein